MITGGGGFLGSFLFKHFRHQHQVYAFSRQELDLSDRTLVNRHFDNNNYDVVIHCAVAGRNSLNIIDPTIQQNNTISWENLVNNKNQYGMLINVASGAEFDLDTNINRAKEEEIWSSNPQHSYGSSKNSIARSAIGIPNFYNLRLFGCFDSSESNTRLIKRVQSQLSQHKIFYVDNDREFDMVSAVDFATVVSAVIDNKITDKDLNVVYQDKHKLSEILKMFARIHRFDDNLISVSTTDLKNYTGDGSKLSKYHLPLNGLEYSLKHYGLVDDGIEPVRF